MSWGAILGAAAGFGSQLLGDAISGHQNRNFQREQSALDYAHQKEFAQNSVQWRVEDAKKAGLHPVYALGANASSFQPAGVYGNSSNFGDSLSSMGQNLASYSMQNLANQPSPFEKEQQALTLKGMQLENKQKELEILAKQKELLRMGQSSAFQGLNPYNMQSSPLGEFKDMKGQSATVTSSGYGIDTPIKSVSFVPMADRSIGIMPSKDRTDWVSESLFDKLDFYADRLLNTEMYRDIVDKALGTDSDIDGGWFLNPRIVPRDPRHPKKNRVPWYRRPIYDFGKKRWFFQSN